MADQPYTSWQTQSPTPDVGAVLPTLPPKLVQGVPVDQPPPDEVFLATEAAILSASQADQWPYQFLGGQQPYQSRNLPVYGRGVDPPPDVVELTDVVMVITAAWQPDPWPQTYIGGRAPYSPKFPPYGAAVDPPPSILPSGYPEDGVVIAAWAADPWPYVFQPGGDAPYSARRMFLYTEAVDQPPRAMPANLPISVAAIFSWQPDPWVYAFQGARQPYQKVSLLPTVLHLDTPPSVVRTQLLLSIIQSWQPDPFAYVYTGPGQPYGQRKLYADLLKYTFDLPPPVNVGRSINTMIALQASQPALWPYQFIGGMQPYQPYNGVDIYGLYPPPFPSRSSAVDMALYAQAWQPEAWPYVMLSRQPYDQRRGSPAYTQAPNDNPPPMVFSRRPAYGVILTSWRDPDPSPFMGGLQPLEPGRLPTVITNTPADQPPFGPPKHFSVIYASWRDPDPLPTLHITSDNAFGIYLSYSFGFVIG